METKPAQHQPKGRAVGKRDGLLHYLSPRGPDFVRVLSLRVCILPRNPVLTWQSDDTGGPMSRAGAGRLAVLHGVVLVIIDKTSSASASSGVEVPVGPGPALHPTTQSQSAGRITCLAPW